MQNKIENIQVVPTGIAVNVVGVTGEYSYL
jgi:hypothetical protein